MFCDNVTSRAVLGVETAPTTTQTGSGRGEEMNHGDTESTKKEKRWTTNRTNSHESKAVVGWLGYCDSLASSESYADVATEFTAGHEASTTATRC